jgi:hypothetical protein
MPRKLINDYVFYKFVCNDEAIECCYVGSTANFSDRKREHKSSCNNPSSKNNNCKIYEIIRANGGWENWKMVIIGEEKEISLTQSRILEQKYINELKANMNTRRAYTTEEEIKEKNRQYKETNKDTIKKYNKAYKEANKEKNKEYNKEYIKAYREANKEKIKEKNKQYYLKKKQEKIV